MLYWKVQKEKEHNLSEELLKIENDFEQGTLLEVKLDMSLEKPCIKVCRYHSKGVCKRGNPCKYLHPNEDCSDYISQRKF